MRRLLILAAVVAIGTFGTGQLLAQEAAEQPSAEQGAEQPSAGEGETPAPSGSSGWSGPGFYLSAVKIAAVWLLFLLWAWTSDWVSRDGQEKKLEYLRWNPIVFGTFMAGFVLVLLIPFFWLGFPLLVIAYAAPLTCYVLHRNKRVGSHETVMTKEHLRYWFADRLAPLGMKIEKEKKDPHTAGPPVVVTAQGGATERDDRTHLLAARQAPGLRDARQILADGLYRRCDAIMLNFTQEAMGVRHMVDGVWHNADPWEREIADSVLEALKILCGLNPEDRRSRQEGTFGAEYLSEKYAVTLTSQGTETGERVVMRFEGKKTQFSTLDDLGMRPKMQEQLKELMAREKGFLLFSAMPATGLRSTTTVALHSTDRFVRELVSVEEDKVRYEEVENISATIYRAAEGQTPDQILPELFLKEPNVVVVRDLVNTETVSLMCQEIANNRLFISTVRAKDSCEALLRVLALGGSPAEFAHAVTAVLCQRLIRKLCEECKEAYAPTPQVLQQLGLPEGKLEALYRPPQAPEQVCNECAGIGYVGRTAIFELLVVDDNVRKVLATNPKLDLLRQAARKARMRTFQEEGLVLVAKGVTSLPELMRVMKQ